MAPRKREQSSDLEDWRVDWLPGKRRTQRKRAAAPAKPRRAKSQTVSEWLPSSATKRRRRAAGSNGGGNGRGNGRTGVAELERRAAKLERELRDERRRARSEIAKLRSRLRKQEAAVSPRGLLDANAASFEQLRELGLTPAQSAKLIARRESAGRFKAKAELRKIPGLSKSAREVIEKRLSVRR
jgi:hypothetical protein